MFTASYLTLSGSAYGTPCKHNALKRAQAAHSVGIPSIGIRIDETLTPRIHRYADTPECEWIDLADPISPEQALQLKIAVADYGVNRVNVGCCRPNVEWWQIGRNLDAVSNLAAELGITVCVEPVVFGSMRTVGEVAHVLDSGLFPYHVGTLYDVWQVSYGVERGLGTRVAAANVVSVQLSGTYRHYDGSSPLRASQDRPLVGWSRESAQTISLTLSVFQGSYVSYELPNARLRGMSLRKVARIVADDMAGITCG